MQTTLFSRINIIVLALFLSACGGGEDAGNGTTMAPDGSAQQSVVQEAVSCPSDPGINYICGLMNAEDLLGVGDTGMVLTSGMSDEETSGHIYLVNPLDDSWEELTSGPNYSTDHDDGMFPGCSEPVDLSDFSSHGLALKETGPARFDLYTTSHGAREAIEVFDLDLSEGIAALSWKGCVNLDPEFMHNSVAILEDGGFVTTQFMRWAGGIESVFGEPNGGIVVWHPGSEPTVIPGSILNAPNGIVVSEDNNTLYVAAFGLSELVRLDISSDPITKESVSLDVVPDNVRWGEPGKLLTAGGNTSGEGWSVIEIDAQSLETTNVGSFGPEITMQGISSALQVNDELWVGTYSGDRIAYFTKQ